MNWIFTVCMFLQFAASPASSQETYTVKPGENILSVIPVSEAFHNPTFVGGTVFFKDGRTVAGNLNFNFLISQVQFIDAKGDTLSLADENTLRHIIIGSDSFYFSKGYVKQIAGWSNMKLAEKIYFKEFVQKSSSYGLSSSATAANSLISINLADRSYQLNTDKEVILVKARQYFFGDRFKFFFVADKKNVLKQFPKHRKEIENYLDKNSIEYFKKDDLIKLAGFLDALIKT